MSKKILLSIITIALVSGLAVAGTYAYYTASVGSSGNHYTALPFQMQVDGVGGKTTVMPVQIQDVYPGWTSASLPGGDQIFSLYGDPKLNGNLKLAVNIPDLATNVLAPQIHVVIKLHRHDLSEVGVLYDGTLAGLASTGADLGALAAADSKELKISYDILTSAGNEIQNKGVWFDVAFTLTQTAP